MSASRFGSTVPRAASPATSCPSRPSPCGPRAVSRRSASTATGGGEQEKRLDGHRPVPARRTTGPRAGTRWGPQRAPAKSAPSGGRAPRPSRRARPVSAGSSRAAGAPRSARSTASRRAPGAVRVAYRSARGTAGNRASGAARVAHRVRPLAPGRGRNRAADTRRAAKARERAATRRRCAPCSVCRGTAAPVRPARVAASSRGHGRRPRRRTPLAPSACRAGWARRPARGLPGGRLCGAPGCRPGCRPEPLPVRRGSDRPGPDGAPC